MIEGSDIGTGNTSGHKSGLVIAIVLIIVFVVALFGAGYLLLGGNETIEETTTEEK